MNFLKHCFYALEQGEAEYSGQKSTEAMKMAIRHCDKDKANLLHYSIESENIQLIRIVLGLVKHLDHKLVNEHKFRVQRQIIGQKCCKLLQIRKCLSSQKLEPV